MIRTFFIGQAIRVNGGLLYSQVQGIFRTAFPRLQLWVENYGVTQVRYLGPTRNPTAIFSHECSCTQSIACVTLKSVCLHSDKNVLPRSFILAADVRRRGCRKRRNWRLFLFQCSSDPVAKTRLNRTTYITVRVQGEPHVRWCVEAYALSSGCRVWYRGKAAKRDRTIFPRERVREMECYLSINTTYCLQGPLNAPF